MRLNAGRNPRLPCHNENGTAFNLPLHTRGKPESTYDKRKALFSRTLRFFGFYGFFKFL